MMERAENLSTVCTVPGYREITSDSGVYFTMISANKKDLSESYREMKENGENVAIEKRTIRSRGMRVELFVLTGKSLAR